VIFPSFRGGGDLAIRGTLGQICVIGKTKTGYRKYDRGVVPRLFLNMETKALGVL
jgi:hypothetical protein